MNRTKIETAYFTWNPMTGCYNKCFDEDCYAYQQWKRFGHLWGYDWSPQLHPERFGEPQLELIPSLIFAPSMGDLFCLKDENIVMLLEIFGSYYWHRFEVQTKFAEMLPRFKYPDNVWLGVSICYQKDVERLDYLKKTNAKIKYAYCEPVLEELNPDFKGIDWVVIGAKTGAHPFQPHPLWVRKLTLLAYEAGAVVFHKSNLRFPRIGEFPAPIKDFPEPDWKGRKNQTSLSTRGEGE